MTSSYYLPKAFSKYELEIPTDVCMHVDSFLQKEPHLCCSKCSVELLGITVIKPFVKDIPVYYKIIRGNVFTPHGMLTHNCSKKADIYLESTEGTLKVGETPDVIDMCGINVKNEVVLYEQSNWYKCLYSENDFIYLCSHCFLLKRKLRRIFYKWKDLNKTNRT